MTPKRILLLSLLLPQYALLVYSVFDEARLLRYQLQFHQSYAIGCAGFSFSPFLFSFYAFGLLAVIRLSGLCSWSRILYSIFAVCVLAYSGYELSHVTYNLGFWLLIDSFIAFTLFVCLTIHSYPHASPTVA